MPGIEVFGEEERDAINHLFTQNGGVLFAHGFEDIRNNIFKVREFERDFAKTWSRTYAVAVSSGSAALKVALKGLGVGPGDEVITQAFTFVATVEAIIEVGATPIIVDIDETYNMRPESLEQAISSNTKVILPVHMAGCQAAMDEILSISQKKNVPVLEDTAQACGGSYKGKLLGTLGDVGAFSFDAAKTLITGEGGMVICNNEEIFKLARSYHDHGHEYSSVTSRGQEKAHCRGFNYRMTEIQAVIGLVQLKKLESILTAQRKNKRKLMEEIAHLPVTFRKVCDSEGEIADTVIIALESKEKALAFARSLRQEGLKTKNIPDAIGWHFSGCWEHMFVDHPIYAKNWNVAWKHSQDLLERSLALPIMIKETETDLQKRGEIIRKIANQLL